MSGPRPFSGSKSLPVSRAIRKFGKLVILTVVWAAGLSPGHAQNRSPESAPPSAGAPPSTWGIPTGETDPGRFAAAVSAAAAAHPREFASVVNAAFSPLNDRDRDRATMAVKALLELRAHQPAAIFELVKVAAAANPGLAETIAEAAMVHAPHYVTRQKVFGIARGSLEARGLRPPFRPVSPGGTLNPASISGDPNSP